jgi:hypothetical protein
MEVSLSRFVPIKIQNFIVTDLVNKRAPLGNPCGVELHF